jgi:hypothetical protein
MSVLPRDVRALLRRFNKTFRNARFASQAAGSEPIVLFRADPRALERTRWFAISGILLSVGIGPPQKVFQALK